MSMIHLKGQLLHTFKATNREGEQKDKIQLLGNVVQPNGETRYDLMTITVADSGKYAQKVGETISVAVGAFAPQKNSVIFFEAR